MPQSKKAADKIGGPVASSAAVGNVAGLARGRQKGHHVVRLQPHPRRRDLVMVSIDASPFFPVVRAKLNKFSYVQRRALVALSRPTEHAVAIATTDFDGWRGAVAAALKEASEGRQA